MAKINLNSVSDTIFAVKANEVSDGTNQRADIVAKGRMLAYAHAQKGKNAMDKALGIMTNNSVMLNDTDYRKLNEQFQRDHLMYAAKKCAEYNGSAAPATWEDFRRNGMNYYGNAHFYAVLQGIYQEIITPILPAVYSEAVSRFADVVEVGFGETYALAVNSNDIILFQDSSWGASRSVPRNRLYTATYTLNPQPKTAMVTAKWTQLVGTGMDFGMFFANIVAGMYSKTMAMWSAAMTTAAANTNLIPSALNYIFSAQNWAIGSNKIAALNDTATGNLIAVGNRVALSKVLPTQATGSVNADMDAALAMLLGRDYNDTGYLGNYLGVRLMPVNDAVVPGTQNTTVDTILSNNDIWMMAANGRKPLTIAYNSATPITIEIDPTKSADFEIGLNLTIALDSAAVFASKIAHFTV